MARRRIKRSSLFTLVAVVALLSLGIGYAAWTDALTINSTVNTGQLELIWDDAQATDNEPVGEDYANCQATIDSAGKNLQITMTGAYPDYQCTVAFNLTNDGSVPAVVTDVSYPDPGDHPEFSVLGLCAEVGDVISPGATFAHASSLADSCAIQITVTDEAVQNGTYSATASFEFASWGP